MIYHTKSALCLAVTGNSVQQKEVCIGIVTQIDLLTYITKHQKLGISKEDNQLSTEETEKDVDDTEQD